MQKGEVEDAIDRVNDLNPEILEHDSKLFFHLQQQRLIELIRQKEVDKALLFAQEYLAPLGEENPGESRPPARGRASRDGRPHRLVRKTTRSNPSPLSISASLSHASFHDKRAGDSQGFWRSLSAPWPSLLSRTPRFPP